MIKPLAARLSPVLRLWEFPKIGDPNIVPQIVGSLLQGPQNNVPLIFGNSLVGLMVGPLGLELLWYGSFRRLGVPYVWGPYHKDPII